MLTQSISTLQSMFELSVIVVFLSLKHNEKWVYIVSSDSASSEHISRVCYINGS